MDAFIDRVIEQFRRRIWDLLARGPSSAAAAQDEARRVYRSLRNREWRDLTRDPEGYMFLAVADVLNAFDGQANPSNAQDRSEAGVSRPAPADTNTTANSPDAIDPSAKPIVARVRTALSDLSPLCRAALILRRRERMSSADIARCLNVQVDEVDRQLKAGIVHCASGRLYSLD